jgi:peptidoglycan-associated lipoprotein
MHGPRSLTLAVLSFAVTLCAPLVAQSDRHGIDGDNALRRHGHGLMHAVQAPETAMQPVQVTDEPNADSLAAATRARADSLSADSLERARLAAERAASASAEEAARLSAALREELAALIHFDFDRAEIQPADSATLDRKVAILAANPAVRLRIGGYCDERGSDGYNMALGERRAAKAKQYLVQRGIDAGRLDAVSSGSGSPVDAGRTEAAWAKNRRAGFEVTRGDTLTAPLAVR